MNEEKFKVGDKVKIVNIGELYSNYHEFIKKYAPNLFENYINSNNKRRKLDYKYTIVKIEKHTDFSDRLVAIIENKNQVLIINIAGLELVKENRMLKGYELVEKIYNGEVQDCEVAVYKKNKFINNISVGKCIEPNYKFKDNQMFAAGMLTSKNYKYEVLPQLELTSKAIELKNKILKTYKEIYSNKTEFKKIKQKLLKEYEYLKNIDIDKEMIPYINKLNNIEYVVTTQSCIGHGQEGFISILVNMNTDKFIKILSNLKQSIVVKVEFEYMPFVRYCIFFNNVNIINELIKELEKIK